MKVYSSDMHSTTNSRTPDSKFEARLYEGPVKLISVSLDSHLVLHHGRASDSCYRKCRNNLNERYMNPELETGKVPLMFQSPHELL